MNNLNQVLIEGNLVNDCEIKKVGETKVSTFTIATHYIYAVNDDGYMKEANFFDCESWGKVFATTAEKYLKKGVFVRVSGRLKQNTWKSEDGKSHSRVVIVADKVNFTIDKNKKALAEIVEAESENIEASEG